PSLEDWLSGPDADDLNDDRVIDVLDYELFIGVPGPDFPRPEDWLAGPDAVDLNDDGEIDFFDYELFFGLPPGPDFSSPEEWLAGPDAVDLNDDGEIDILDYELFFGRPPGHDFPSLEDWLSGPDADDLNDDRVIDVLDYELFIDERFIDVPGHDFPPPEEWLAGPEAEDLNEDDVIDILDFDIWKSLQPLPTFREWILSDEAMDLNGDEVIDEADYAIFANPQPEITLQDWLEGPLAQDYDLNDFVDHVDFEVYLWIESPDASDVNEDGAIDYTDLTEFLLTSGDTAAGTGTSPIVIDFDPADGDQERRLGGNARPDREYSLQFNITDVPEIKGWSLTLNYDPAQLEFVGRSFQLTDFITGGLPLLRNPSGELGIGTTVLTGNVSASGTASLGSIKMRVLDGFTGSTDVEIVRFGLRLVEGDQTFESVSSIVTISDEVLGTPPPGDFDGDGVVDFPDFFLFADAFWTTSEEFDLSGDGFVDFRDFFLFADFFGQQQPLFKLMALAQDVLGLPVQVQLEQNYPNPFNSQTVIPFAVPGPSQVRLRIFDVLGQQVRALDPGLVGAGLHRVSWNGRNDDQQAVAAGVYIARLQVLGDDGENVVEVRKLTLAE
ncbi:MAG: FlgD immunoglobulin-like domain containing protein, partial [Candidatus Latescibacterota bacterium]|nr:FlgD immunoglobulin-like domain containing protein [Candidatus Latescibacterota bacterium]